MLGPTFPHDYNFGVEEQLPSFDGVALPNLPPSPPLPAVLHSAHVIHYVACLPHKASEFLTVDRNL